MTKENPTVGSSGAQNLDAGGFKNHTTHLHDLRQPAAKNLSQEHLDELHSSAITDDFLLHSGTTTTYTAYSKDGAPDDFQWLADEYFPLLVYEMQEADGTDTVQVKPAKPFQRKQGEKPAKYLSPNKKHGVLPPPKLPAIRPVDPMTRTVLLVEGTKQSRAVASYAPSEYAVHQLTGIYGWSEGDGVATPYLDLVANFDVIVIPDADVKTNYNVYQGAKALGEVCLSRGATRVRFVDVEGAGKQGIDDVLAQREPAKRAAFLNGLLQRAGALPKTAPPKSVELSVDKVAVDMDQTSGDVKKQLERAIHESFCGGGTRTPALFSRLNKLVFLQNGHGGRLDLEPADKDLMYDLATDCCEMVRYLSNGAIKPAEPSSNLLGALLKKWSMYPEIVGISTTPLVRKDGTIITTTGYDPVTKLFVHLSDDLEGLVIPEHPTDEELATACEEILDPLAQFAFAEESDRSRAIAALMTPFIRQIIPVSPMFGFLGLGRSSGIGKGLLLQVNSTIHLGHAADIMKFTSDSDEMRKRLLSELLDGQTILNLDEVGGDLFSGPLNAFLTAERWRDRELGKSKNHSIRNVATAYVAGNNFTISLDSSRRTVLVNFRSDEDPTQASKRITYKYPKLVKHVKEHRKTIVWAYLTLIRAWFDRGKPSSTSNDAMASFEEWQDIVEGCLGLMGRTDMMEGVLEQRQGRDQVTQQIISHFEALDAAKFVGKDFTCADVLSWARKQSGRSKEYELPYGVDLRSTPRQLASVYATLSSGGWYGDYKLTRPRKYQGTWVYRLTTRRLSPLGSGGSGGSNGGGGGSTPPQGPVPSPPPIPGARPQPAAAPALPAGAQPAGHRPTVRDMNGNVSPAPSWLPASCIPARPGFFQMSVPVDESKLDRELFDAIAEGTDVAPVVFDDRVAQLEGSGVLDVDGAREGLDVLYFNLTPEGEAERRLGSDPCERISVPALVDAMQSVDLIVGYDVFGETAQVLSNHGFDLVQAVSQNKVRDVLVMARQCDPPAQQRDDSLVALAKRYCLPAHTDIDRIQSLFRYLPCDEYGLREHRALLRVGKAAAGEVCIDTAELEADIASFIDQRNHTVDWLETKYGVEARTKDGKRSKAPWATEKGLARLAEVFNGFGIDVPLGTNGKPSLKRDFLDQVADDEALSGEARELAQRLARAKEALPAMDVKKHLSAAGTVRPRVSAEQTFGRLTTADPALNTFGKREPRLLGQRRVILPDSKDEVLFAFDFGQIDARMMAVGSQDEAYLANFAAGVDSHTALAERLWGDPSRRPDAKKVAHAMNYGMGAESLAKNLGWAVADAQTLLDEIAQQYPKLHEFKQRLRTQATRHGYIKTGFGRRVRVNKQNAYTQAPAAYGQGTARDILTEALLRMDLDTVGRIKMFVHDEIVVSVPKDKADEYRNEVLQAMTFEFTPQTLLDASDSVVSVSVIADASNPGVNWAKCYAD